MSTPTRVSIAAENGAERLNALDWQCISQELENQGSVVLERLASADECRALAAMYFKDEFFRSRVVMGRHGFGRGEYKYFNYPLPDVIAELRTGLYPRLAPVATGGTPQWALKSVIQKSTANSSGGATTRGR